MYVLFVFFFIFQQQKIHQRMDRNQTMPNMRKPYENSYAKSYEGASTWRGSQDGNGSADRYGQKPAAPRFQGNNQFNGHQAEAIQNGADGKQMRQPRPTNYQNRQNGTYIPRTNVGGTGAAVVAQHQAPPYGVNPNPNGYQGNRGKTEVNDIKPVHSMDQCSFDNHLNHFLTMNKSRDSIKIATQIIAIKVDQLDKTICKLEITIPVIHIHSNRMRMA